MGKVIDLGFNLEDVQEFQTPPPGIYEVECVKLDSAVGPSGDPYINFEFVITDSTGNGARLWDNASTGEKARFRLKRIMRCLEHQLTGGKLEEDAIKGKHCLVETFVDDSYLDPKTQKPRPRLKIQDYFPLEEKALRTKAAAAGENKPDFSD